MKVIFTLYRNSLVLSGLIILGIIFLVTLLGPVLAPYDPMNVDPPNKLLPISIEHPLGTDILGRDVFSRLLYGGRIALSMTLVAVACIVFIGISVGVITGYYSGLIDEVISSCMNILLGLPGLSFMLAIAGVLGPGIRSLFIALVAVSWVSFARVVRGEVLKVREAGYIEAARAVGASNLYIITRYILPNILGPVLVLATLRMGNLMLSIAALSFLGLGVQPPTPDWAVMLNDGRAYFRSHPHQIIAPGLCIMMVALAANLLGDGLRDLLDVRLNNRKTWD